MFYSFLKVSTQHPAVSVSYETFLIATFICLFSNCLWTTEYAKFLAGSYTDALEILSVSHNLPFFFGCTYSNRMFSSVVLDYYHTKLVYLILQFHQNLFPLAGLESTVASYLSSLNMQPGYLFPTQKDLQTLIGLTFHLGQKDLSPKRSSSWWIAPSLNFSIA